MTIRSLIVFAAVFGAGLCLLPSLVVAQTPLLITTLTETKVAKLPPGKLFWRIETFPALTEAKAAAGAWSLVTEYAGKVWLFTLGPAGGASPGGTRVAEVGPISRVAAPQYLLRINEASGSPGSITPVHSHAGSEAFFVLAGEQSVRSPHGTMRVGAGHGEPGHGAGMPMQVSSSGSTSLHALVMFVVDATKPFSSPAQFPK